MHIIKSLKTQISKTTQQPNPSLKKVKLKQPNPTNPTKTKHTKQ